MILRIEDIKDTCQKIANALDNVIATQLSDTLLIEAKGGILTMAVTNRDYYVEVLLPVDINEDFKATVNANLFLQLISKTTTDTVELSIKDTYLQVKANGTNKFPLIFDGYELLELPRIELNNITSTMIVDGDILNSILNFNSKQLELGQARVEAQRYYYLDQEGCITATGGACINSFHLDKPCRLMLNKRLVKLFKLFKNESVEFNIAMDEVADVIQTKASFITPDVRIYAIISCDDKLINSFPEPQVRALGNKDFDYSITLNKNDISEMLERIILFQNFTQSLKPYGILHFGKDSLTIEDSNKCSNESIYYLNDESGVNDDYVTMLDLKEFKALLDTCTDQCITMNFGDHRAIVISRGTIKNIIQEIPYAGE